MGAAQKARTRTRCRPLFLARKERCFALRSEPEFTVCKPLSLWMPSRDLPEERGTRETETYDLPQSFQDTRSHFSGFHSSVVVFFQAAGKSSSFTVKFVPQTSGSASGSLSFKSNATTSTTVEALSGSGTAGTSHSVALTWSPESAVSGYNVYRGTKSGGPYSKINSVLDASASFP